MKPEEANIKAWQVDTVVTGIYSLTIYNSYVLHRIFQNIIIQVWKSPDVASVTLRTSP